jgi:hypothetical protein
MLPTTTMGLFTVVVYKEEKKSQKKRRSFYKTIVHFTAAYM